ncbi:MAG: universal stress protein [Candidatus Melainabacteria bacterium]|jgi:nucleotide-binding universal stress UspA family protein|nr:universal stress protein [Candidatus Melainabacteria bacterium]
MQSSRILVAIDGSEYSQIASQNAFFVAKSIEADLEAQAVVDPRIVDMFLSPEFAEDLGLKPSIDASATIIKSLKRIAGVVLKLWQADCREHMGKEGKIHLDVGNTTDDILKRSKGFDLVVVGHRGVGYKNHQPSASHFRIGSVAERVAVGANKSVLIAVKEPSDLKCILVAYDGSEASKGALLLAEQMAMKTGLLLKAIHVVKEESQKAQASSVIEQGACLLKNYSVPVAAASAGSRSTVSKESGNGDRSASVSDLMREVFVVTTGPAAKTILDEAESRHALLILGAYGFRDPDDNVLGSTTTQVVRSTRSNVLVFR